MRKILNSWEGTPYRHATILKGRAADCLMFVAEVYREMGVLEKYEHEYYPKDWYLHQKEELALNYFIDNMKFIRPGYRCDIIEPEEPRDGDILLFAMIDGLPITHSAIFFEGKLWHVNTLRGVCHTKFGPAWKQKGHTR